MKTKAFTIIEALIGISVLAMAIVAPITLASRAIYAIQLSKDQTIASQLAQEALEIVRQKRDNELIRLLKNPIVQRNSWLAAFGVNASHSSKTFVVDVVDISRLYDCNSINDECARLYILDGFYRASEALSGPEKSRAKVSRFKRIVDINYISDDEIQVKVSVRWITGTFGQKIITIEERLKNFIPKRN